MEKNILKIDLDEKKRKKAILKLRERFAYMHDLDFMHIDEIEKIELIYKNSYGCKTKVKEEFKTELHLIVFQLLLGSDWMKEINTIINHYKFNMEYSNRLFTCKRYKDEKIKIAKIENITKEIRDYVKNDNRKKNYN